MPEPLPDRLVHQAVSSRHLQEQGVSRRAASGPLWARPYRGVRVWAAREQTAPLTRIDASVVLLPRGGVLGGWGAAYLGGVRCLDGVSATGEMLPVDHVVPVGSRLRQKAGITLHREGLEADAIRRFGRIPVTSPGRTAVDTARWAADLVEAVVAIDAMLFNGYVTRHEVASGVAASARRRGIPQARAALDLSDERAESPWETRLRMAWVLGAGLPVPDVNVDVMSGGRFLGRPDLVDVEAGLVLEYDGAHHRGIRQHTADNAREERLERAGLRVIRFTYLDLLDEAACVRRLQLERSRRLGRDRSGETWNVVPRPARRAG